MCEGEVYLSVTYWEYLADEVRIPNPSRPRGRLGAIVWSLAHITQAPPNTRPCWWPGGFTRCRFSEETQLLLHCIQRFHSLSLWFSEVNNHLASWLLKKIKLKTRAHPFLRDLRKTNPRTPSLLRQSGSSWTDCQLDALDLSSVVSIVLYSLWLRKRSQVAKLYISCLQEASHLAL